MLKIAKTFRSATTSTRTTPKFEFRTFFLKGTDQRQLSQSQTINFQQFITENSDQPDPSRQSSFFIYNQHEALRKIKLWREKLSWIQPFYALKSNPIQPLIHDVVQSDCGLDCASSKEIQIALDNGISPTDIVYSNSVKEEKDISFAAESNVLLTTADTFEELEKIQQLAPQMRILWRISIAEEAAQELATVFSNKFGDDIASFEEAEMRFKKIKEMGIKLAGVHFHCGSGKNGAKSFDKAINLARNCIKIGRKHGHSMEIMDLGGGYPAADLNSSLINALKQTRNDPLGYRVMAEPGRHLSSTSCYMMMRVIGKRSKFGKTCYHVNESLYHSFNSMLMDGMTFENDQDQLYAAVDHKGQPTQVSELSQSDTSIFGMTCDGMDVLAKNIRLPTEIQVGDWLCMGGMGAYTYGPRSEFNGMQSATRIVNWNGKIGEEIVNGNVTQEELIGRECALQNA